MNSNTPIFAFTTKSANGLLLSLQNQVSVSYKDNVITAVALWDTGATNTCISHDVVSQLSLIPTGMKRVQTSSGASTFNTYLVDIILPNSVRVANIEVCDSSIGDQGIGVLVGMDIITQGDFSVSNFEGNTVFSFRIPSAVVTDYVEEINIQNKVV